MKKGSKRMWRKAMALVLAMVLSVGNLSVTAFAAETDGLPDEDNGGGSIHVDLLDGGVPEFPAGGSDQDKLDWFQDNVQQPEQSDDVPTLPGMPGDNAADAEPEGDSTPDGDLIPNGEEPDDDSDLDAAEPDSDQDPDATEPDGGQDLDATEPDGDQDPDATVPDGDQDPDATEPDGGQDPDATEPDGDQDPDVTVPDGTGSEDGTEPDGTPGLETPGVDVPVAKPDGNVNWSVFWNEKTQSYELTYEIADDAHGDQVVDLTKALELLNQYAQSIENAEKPVKPLEPSGVSEEDQQKYEEDKAAFDKVYEDKVIGLVIMANDENYIKNHTVEEIVAEFNYWAPMFGYDKVTIPVKPEGEVDKDSPEYAEYLEKMAEYEKLLADYNRQENANVLQPGDIRKFTIYLTSKSGHTYRYKDGSFTLATPDLSGRPDLNQEGVNGFDGQLLPDGANGHIDKESSYNVSAGMKPIMDMLVELGIPEYELKAGHDSFEELVTIVMNYKDKDGRAIMEEFADRLGLDYTFTDSGNPEDYERYNCQFENLNGGIQDYLVKYYSELDGREYKDLNEVFSLSIAARNDLTDTSNSAAQNQDMTFGGDHIGITYGKDFTYNQFYQQLLGFIYGDQADIDGLLGDPTGTNNSNHPEFGPDSWGSGDLGLDYSVALEQYMSHQAAWEAANAYFNKLLGEGLSSKDAMGKAFAMAVNMDGSLTSNEWQLTKWGWSNSIELEQMDFSFNLTKTDMETGEIIADSDTGFAIWYNSDDGNKMYCHYDESTGDYYFDATEAVVTTQNGQLNIDFTMLKDIVYYLQEVNAPDGYEVDPTVYLIMNSDDYASLSDQMKAEIQNETNGEFGFLDLDVSDDGLTVSTDFGNVKIVAPPEEPDVPPVDPEDPDVPPVDPEGPDVPPVEPDDPDVPPVDPEEPPVDPAPPVIPPLYPEIPDPDVPLDPTPEVPTEPIEDIPDPEVPLVGTPEFDDLVEISDENVPLTDIPETEDAPEPEDIPEEEFEIPDPNVPLADVPQTGDDAHMAFYAVLMVLSLAGLALLAFTGKAWKNQI